tara:strand:- start:215 stop:352 length:138 start_codon:yes stop_codon:yes gene_type:complete
VQDDPRFVQVNEGNEVNEGSALLSDTDSEIDPNEIEVNEGNDFVW